MSLTQSPCFLAILASVGGHTVFPAELCISASDPANLPLHDTAVVVVNLLTQTSQRVATDDEGKVCLRSLTEGLYSVELSKRGFLTTKYYPVRVSSPGGRRLLARLPFGEVTEGGVLQESTIGGTLKDGDKLLVDATICLFREGTARPEVCMITNELGEYASVVVPAVYRFEVLVGTDKHTGTIDAAVPGSYRIRLVGQKHK